MARYGITKIQKIKSNTGNTSRRGSTEYRSTYYSKIPLSDNDRHIIAQEGDRLDRLAVVFYGTPSLWWYIARANNLNSMNVTAGTKLRVPSSPTYTKGK